MNENGGAHIAFNINEKGEALCMQPGALSFSKYIKQNVYFYLQIFVMMLK